jgi:solute carrier family 25 carnitine/acylcarnitine transporter 20/29
MDYVQDMAAGSAGAIAKITVGHPLETLKVRMQSTSNTGNSLSVLRNLVRNEGVSSLYRGVAPTAMSMLVYNSSLFASFGFVLDRVSKSKSESSLHHVALAGGAAGAFCSILTAPLELVRTRMQGKLEYQLLQGLQDTWKISGLFGLYKGCHLMILREIPANAFYFGTFEAILRVHGFSMSDQSRYHFAPPELVFLAGGAAGVANWLFVYPIDTIKTQIQTDSLTSPKYLRVRDCIQEHFVDGVLSSTKTLFRGYSACLLRAFLANATTFSAAEFARYLAL